MSRVTDGVTDGVTEKVTEKVTEEENKVIELLLNCSRIHIW